MSVQETGPAEDVRMQTIAAAATVATIPGPPTAEVGRLWEILVLTLSVVLLMSLVGIVWTVADGNPGTSPDVIVTIFSSALTGLLGLFVKSPN